MFQCLLLNDEFIKGVILAKIHEKNRSSRLRITFNEQLQRGHEAGYDKSIGIY